MEYEVDIVEDSQGDSNFDICEFLYQNDPDFHKMCNEEMEKTGLELNEVMKLKKVSMVDDQKKAYKNFGSLSQEIDECETPHDKVIRNIESKEQEAVKKFQKNVLSEQDSNSNNSAKYSSKSKSQKRPTAVLYAEIAKENTRELQTELIDAQQQMINDLWLKQEEFLKKNTRETLEKEEEIALKATDRLVQGLVAGFAGSSRRVPENSPKKQKNNSKNRFTEDFHDSSDDGYFGGLDSSYLN